MRAPKVDSSGIFDLLQQIESSDDDVSRRVAQGDSDTLGPEHAVDNEDGADTEKSVGEDLGAVRLCR